jgi:outer membrane protein assembly factor BamB
VATVDLPFTATSMNQVLGSSSGPATGEVEALNLTTGHVEWDTKVADLPLGATTVSNDLLFTTLFKGVLIALNRNTGAVVWRQALPTSTNSPIAIAGNTVLVAAGAVPKGPGTHGGRAQLVAYTA